MCSYISKLLIAILTTCGGVLTASVQHVENLDPVPIIVRAGMMTTKYESVLIADEVDLEEGESLIVTGNAQFVNEMQNITLGVGRYLVVIEPDGEETYLVRPHCENLMGKTQHYQANQLTGLWQARMDGLHRFEYRGYCGTFNLRKDSQMCSVYNEMTIMVLER